MAPEAILVTQLATRRHPLTPQHISAISAPWQVVERLSIKPPTRDELDEFDESYPWTEAAAAQQEQFQKVREAMVAWPDARIVYMGFAPVPLVFHLGSLFGQTADVAIFQHHHQNRDWRWPSDDETPGLLADFAQSPAKPDSDREVLIRVSSSYPVTSDDTQWISGEKMHEIALALATPTPDGLRSTADLNTFVRGFKRVIDAAHNDFRSAPLRHLAASVPVGAALAMGMQINPTTHLPIQTWKYLGSRKRRYVRALCLGEFVDIPKVLLLGASPVDQDAISAAGEVQELGDLLAAHHHRLAVVQRPSAGVQSLTMLLEEINPTVLHLACHGETNWKGTTTLHLTTMQGWSCMVETEDFLRLLGRASNLSCVVLMACHSATLAQQIAEKVPTAIGWVGELHDRDARGFARDFWLSLIAGHSIGSALRDGRMAMLGPRDQVTLEVGRDVDPDILVPVPKF